MMGIDPSPRLPMESEYLIIRYRTPGGHCFRRAHDVAGKQPFAGVSMVTAARGGGAGARFCRGFCGAERVRGRAVAADERADGNAVLRLGGGDVCPRIGGDGAEAAGRWIRRWRRAD